MEKIDGTQVRNSQLAMFLSYNKDKEITLTDEQKEFIDELNAHKGEGDCACVFVGTWAKYNEGLSLDGAWLNLETFSSSEEFCDFCKLLHNDEEDAELAILDSEHIPSKFSAEDAFVSDDIFEFFENYSDEDREIIMAYWEELDDSAEADFIMDGYMGKYDSIGEYCKEVEYESVPKEYHYLIDMIPEDAFETYGYDITKDGYLFLEH